MVNRRLLELVKGEKDITFVAHYRKINFAHVAELVDAPG